jgi:2-polyprenyl-6-methoxyphenol hydroxylase-like FAD-dependent oxidoreductase
MKTIGGRAVVIGAGVGGIAAASALAGRFDEVLVLERDSLPAEPKQRLGVQQGRHLHMLLTGGQRAFEGLLPGFTEAILAAGAVAARANLDSRLETPGFDPPRRDLGWFDYCASRPLIEFVARSAAEKAGVEFRSRTRVRAVETTPDEQRVCAVSFERDGSPVERLTADLVIDASGHAGPTLALLKDIGRPAPEETTIGIDFGYATQVFEIPPDAPTDWKILATAPDPRHRACGGMVAPIEGDCWIVALAGRGDDTPTATFEGFMAFASGLRTPSIFNAIKHANPVGDVAGYGFRESVRRHFDRIPPLPRGLIPFGDSRARFNPVYGQGMSVAALEAGVLARLLQERDREADPIEGLAEAFGDEAESVIDWAWRSSAIPDLALPQTRGERPPDLDAILRFGFGLALLAARDPEAHKLEAEVRGLIKPPSVLTEDPALVRRVEELVRRVEARLAQRAADAGLAGDTVRPANRI